MADTTNTTKKILLVEDDDQLQSSYKKLFEAEHYQVFQAFTGDEGIEQAVNQKPDIILLDIMLKGGTNGFDVLESLKKNRDLFNIPVLMLTNLDSERKLALSIGAVDYLVKANTSIDVLLEKVRNYIDNKPATLDDSQFTAPRPEESAPVSNPTPTEPGPITSENSTPTPVSPVAEPTATTAEQAPPMSTPVASPEPVAETVAEPASSTPTTSENHS